MTATTPAMSPLEGPHASAEVIPAPEELEPRTRIGAAASPASPYEAVEVWQWGELVAGQHAMCRVVVKVASGWYAGNAFRCGDADNRTSTKLAALAITVMDGKISIRFREDFESHNMDDDGLHAWARTPVEITCAMGADAKPACSDLQRGKEERGSEPLATGSEPP